MKKAACCPLMQKETADMAGNDYLIVFSCFLYTSVHLHAVDQPVR
jgi:hypothetical protein